MVDTTFFPSIGAVKITVLTATANAIRIGEHVADAASPEPTWRR